MRVPISMAGQQFYYQLDTGADEVIPYGAAQHRGWIARHEGVRIPDVSFAGMHLPAILAYRNLKMPDTNLQGTVGLDLLIGHVFLIDFPRRRICMFPKADLPEGLDEATDWSPAEIRHGKLFLSVELNGKRLPDIFFDTGSSPSTLDVDLDLWQQATGRSGPADATTHGSGLSWGEPREGFGAMATGSLKIGTHVYPHPEIATNRRKPTDYRDNFQAQGLLGNALFLRDIVILDLGSHPQFGVVTP